MSNKCEIYLAAQSLFFNMASDLGPGHSPTVATNIMQKGALSPKISAILDFENYYVDSDYPDLTRILTKKARTTCAIKRIYIFKKITLNRTPIKTDSCFCMFVKEETDKSKEQFGRLSLHYPLSLKYEALNINNQEIINEIKNRTKGYAARVLSMDLDGDSLNFNCIILGQKDSPLSLAFASQNHNKLWASLQMPYYMNHYYLEKTILQKRLDTAVDLEILYKAGIDAYQDVKLKAFEMFSKNKRDAIDVSLTNPLCPYDIFYRDSDGKAHYCIVKFSFSNQLIYTLSERQHFFMLAFPKSSTIIFYQGWGDKTSTKILNFEEYLQLSN